MQANSVEVKPIFPDSEEAAKFVTGINGWIDRNGFFFGENESSARNSGSTHRHCDCGAVISKNSYCKACVRSREIEKYNNAQKIEWDHETPLYSQVHDEYFFDESELIDFMGESDVTAPEELELFICESVKLSHIDGDYWDDDLPEDHDLPDNVQSALDALNKAIDEADAVGWHPGKVAAIVNLGVAEENG